MFLGFKKRINSLMPSAQFEHKAQVEYYYQLSMMLREAIELRTNIRATDLTYQELKKPIESKLPVKSDVSSEVLLFLERADLIKFAEQPATLEEATHAKALVTRWTQLLTPREDVMQDVMTQGLKEKTGKERHVIR